MVFRNFFAGQVREQRSFAEELDERGLVVKAGAADDVVDVVAVEPISRGQEDVVVSAGDDLMRGQHSWLRAFDFVLGYELEEMRRDVEGAGGRAVAHGDGHASFTGDE